MNSTEETIFLCGEDYFEALLTDIAHAKKCIDLETYIFNHDALGQRILEALLIVAQRGVKIRILVDGAGTPGWNESITQKLEAAGIEARVYHPFPWRFWQWRHAMIRLPFLTKILFFIFKMNKRNHRKVCMIDKNIIYIGSANISQCHVSEQQGGRNWRDTIVRLVGANTTDLEYAFETAWNHTAIQERLQHLFTHINTNATIRLNYTRHRRRVLYKNLLRRIGRCKMRVWITNAYFIPDNFLLKKLKELAERGIDVRVLLPQKADVFIMPWASSAFYESLLKSGVRIFEYMPTMLHAKSIILDNWFMVGSSNLNHRSLLHDLEVDVVICEPSSKRAIVQQFIHDLTLAKEIDLTNWHKRTWLQKLIGRLLLYIKYWI